MSEYSKLEIKNLQICELKKGPVFATCEYDFTRFDKAMIIHEAIDKALIRIAKMLENRIMGMPVILIEQGDER